MDIDTAKKVATLARLRLKDDADAENSAKQLSGIIAFVEQLGEVDTEGVKPLASANDDIQPLREDVINDGYTGNIGTDTVLKNAPEKNSGYFVVPKVVE